MTKRQQENEDRKREVREPKENDKGSQRTSRFHSFSNRCPLGLWLSAVSFSHMLTPEVIEVF